MKISCVVFGVSGNWRESTRDISSVFGVEWKISSCGEGMGSDAHDNALGFFVVV